MKNSWLVPPTDIGNFSTIIDVRTPLEFSEDHVPGAINCPVLSNEQRAKVGTIYKQVSPFEAKKIGGALIAANIATHIQQQMLDMPKGWRPLIYCWRGGMRSGAMQIILRQIGWQAHKLEGGYKAFRHHVIEQTALLAPRLPLRILPGDYPELAAELAAPGTCVIMKSGRELAGVKRLIRNAGLHDRARMVVNCGMPDEAVYHDIEPAQGGYFSTILIGEETEL